ncbi:MAG: hypothetical protein WEB06_21770 [Actinomycetota bacterium]
MAKAAKVLCDRCESRITVGVSFCDRCGGPTQWASHQERVGWELTQWQAADRTHAPGSPSKGNGSARRWIPRPFGRKESAQPKLTLVPPKSQQRVEVSAPTPAAEPDPVPAVAAVPEPPTRKPDPKPTAVRAAVKPFPWVQPTKAAPKIEPRIEPRIEKGPRDAEPLRDTPATVMAMRLLNARVAELDAKVQRLERALEGEDAISLP